MTGFKNTWVEGVHYDVIPQSEISKINKKISEDSTLNVDYKPERMYSEEDMQEYAEFCVECDRSDLKLIVAKDWFKQFKKK
tara:strand:+ start:122 stop:364 length:243 start_codon:yes stop_codon:yes gene_type:complete